MGSRPRIVERFACHTGGHRDSAQVHIAVVGLARGEAHRLLRNGGCGGQRAGAQGVVAGSRAVATGDPRYRQTADCDGAGRGHVLAVVGLAAVGQRGGGVARDKAGEAVGRRHCRAEAAVVGLGGAAVGQGRRERFGVDGDAIHPGAVAQRWRSVVAGNAAAAVGQRDGIDILVGRGDVGVAGSDSAVVQIFAAHQIANGHVAAQAGRAVVGLAACKRHCAGADVHRRVGVAQRWQGVVAGQSSRTIGQGDGVDVLVGGGHMRVTGGGGAVRQCFAGHAGGNSNRTGKAGVAVVSLGSREAHGLLPHHHAARAAAERVVGVRERQRAHAADGTGARVLAGQRATAAGHGNGIAIDRAAGDAQVGGGNAGAAVVGFAAGEGDGFGVDSEAAGTPRKTIGTCAARNIVQRQ